MRILPLLTLGLILLACKDEGPNQNVHPCHEFETPSDWQCEERINYQFCFSPDYISQSHLFYKSDPPSYLSKGVWVKNKFVDIDPDQYVTFPFPDQIEVPEYSPLIEKVEICDDGDLIGVFYYGNIQLIDEYPYPGYLYLRSDNATPKYYLSAFANGRDGLDDLIKAIMRIKKIK